MTNTFNQELWIAYQNETVQSVESMTLEELKHYITNAEEKVFEFKTKESRARAIYRERAAKLPLEERNRALGSLDGSYNFGKGNDLAAVKKAHQKKATEKTKELGKLAKAIKAFKTLGYTDEMVTEEFKAVYTNEQINKALEECRSEEK